jgi:hypothetical protein
MYKTVFDFFCKCRIPYTAKVNVYDAKTKIILIEDYQDLTGNSDIDFAEVRGYKWNPKTNLLKIYAA